MKQILASTTQENGFQEAGIFAILILLTILQHMWANKAGLFQFHTTKTGNVFPSFKILGQIFLIYFSFTFILPSLLFGVLRNVLFIIKFDVRAPYAGMMIHTISLLGCLFSVVLFLQTIKPSFLQFVWKRDPNKSIISDLFLGFCGFLLSYPVVLIAGNFFDWLIRAVFKFVSYEQVAVKYLKNTEGQIVEMVVALFTIVLFAPIVEELLFRGFLQTYLRRYLKPQPSFLISGFLFALFHYSTSQSYGNISVILTLFVLGWYLGIIYEKQGSLLSVIFFHALFNITSAWRVLLDTSGGTT